MGKLFTHYIIVDNYGEPYHLGKDGVLVYASNRRAVAIFPTKKAAQKVIRAQRTLNAYFPNEHHNLQGARIIS